MVIYADVLFIINFCMDFICLYVTSKLCRAVTKAYRLVIASAIGGIYAVIACTLEGVSAFIGALGSAMLICIVALKSESNIKLLKHFLTFFLTSFLMGGVSFCIYSLSGRSAYYNGTLYADVGAFPLILTGAASGAFVILYIRKTRSMITATKAEISIELNGKSITLTSLVDSGLLLCDTISADPVILIKRESYRTLCGDTPVESLSGFRLIPSDRGLIYAFRPQKVFVKSNDSKKREVVSLIGIDNFDGTFSGADALFPASIL